MYRLFLFFVLFTVSNAIAQTSNLVVSGPMLGHTELRTSKVWVELKTNVKGVKLIYNEVANPKTTGTAIGCGY